MLPWGYKRAFVCCALLFLLGTVFQWMWGAVPPHFLHYPWSVIAALVYTYALVVLYSLSGRFPRLRRLSDTCASVASIVSVAGLSILFGLIPQSRGASGIAAALGWTDMRSCWAFHFLLLYLMTGIGISAVSGLYHLRTAKPAATLSHLAVYLVLCAGFFGSGDKQELLVTAEQGIPVAVGKTGDGVAGELPFMILLNDFDIEEYPDGGGPMRYLSDVTLLTGSGRPHFGIAVNHPARLGPWRIYQYGYDLSQGKESRISELLCVKDGWYPVLAAGLWLLLGAGVLMFLTAGGRRLRKEGGR